MGMGDGKVHVIEQAEPPHLGLPCTGPLDRPTNLAAVVLSSRSTAYLDSTVAGNPQNDVWRSWISKRFFPFGLVTRTHAQSFPGTGAVKLQNMAATVPLTCTRRPHRVRHMKKRRLSIQAIFNRDVDLPNDGKFKTLPRSFAAPVDSFFLDDDPFADLTSAPVRDTPPVSPLADHVPPVPTRSHTHTTPAHQKPAFKTRPSLPSLHTLAQMNVVVPHKV
ncbi:hypothetical protein B0H12DRAFT_793219 [Mycena haematopus]|nr:hypothetical protein B0H12DRAFT_793219 [Mycena haematopus]